VYDGDLVAGRKETGQVFEGTASQRAATDLHYQGPRDSVHVL
jgi:hypothetical protein